MNVMPREIRAAMGLEPLRRAPQELLIRVNTAHSLRFALASAANHGLKYAEVKEAFPQSNARYIGARLLPSR